MSETILASLKNEDERTTIRKCTYNVILADGSKTNILGVKICKIQLGQHVVNLEVLVIENLHEKCLLGLDFLNKCPTTKIHMEQLKQVLKATDMAMINNINDICIIKTLISSETEESIV